MTYLRLNVCFYTYIHTYITLRYVTLHYITLHCIALHCIALYYITLRTYITYMCVCKYNSIHISYIYIYCSYMFLIYVLYTVCKSMGQKKQNTAHPHSKVDCISSLALFWDTYMTYIIIISIFQEKRNIMSYHVSVTFNKQLATWQPGVSDNFTSGPWFFNREHNIQTACRSHRGSCAATHLHHHAWESETLVPGGIPNSRMVYMDNPTIKLMRGTPI